MNFYSMRGEKEKKLIFVGEINKKKVEKLFSNLLVEANFIVLSPESSSKRGKRNEHPIISIAFIS